jgi:serpin B
MHISSAASFVGTWKNPSCELDVVNDMYIFNNNSFQNYFYKSIEKNKISGETYNGVVREYTDGFSFVGLVPSEKEGVSYTLEDVFSELMSDKNKYTNLLSLKKKSGDVAVVLPNYKNSVDTPTTTDLTEVIRDMGADEMMKKSANFGNMAKDSTNLHLDKFSVSGDIVITPLSHGAYSKDAKAISDEAWKNCKDAVVFDKSFVYFIVDNASGLPIYFALVNDLN